MILVVDFFRDLARFRRNGLLSTALYRLFARRELVVCATLVGFLFYQCYVADVSRAWVLYWFFVAILLHFLFVSYLVKYLSPIYFGKPVHGRLSKEDTWAK